MVSLPTPCESARHERVLIVDDEVEIRETLADMLEFEGYDVECVEDGARAQEALARATFDAVLTDLHMPGVDGMELVQVLRRSFPDLPVIVITGYPTLQKGIEAMKRGAVDFLPKPFDLDTVLHILHRAFKERSLTLENQRLATEVNRKAVIEELNRELHQRVDELIKINTISEQLSQVLDTEDLFQMIVDLAGSLTDAQRVSLMLRDRRTEVLRIRAASGISRRVMQQTIVSIGEGVAGSVAVEKKPLRITQHAPYSKPGGETRFDRYESQSWVSVPILIGGELFGVLNVTDKRANEDFSSEDERIMMRLSEKAAAKIENNALYESLYDNLFDTLASLVTTIEAKDPYTRLHSQRVSDFAVTLGERLGVSRDEQEALRFATMLHDIGKIGVRDIILLKPGRLTPQEFRRIQLHPQIGERIVEPLGLTSLERDIIRHHHERLNGSGYPDGLKGEAISILARIVSVSDAFDAMTSTRSYRKAMSVEEALEEIRSCGGKQFDPAVVEELVEGICSGAVNVPPLEERLSTPPPQMDV